MKISLSKQSTIVIMMMFLTTLSFSQIQQPGSAPVMPVIVPTSPTVANLMNFEEVPVDKYTGQPDINIPLYDKQLNSELNLPLVLKYSSLGVRLKQRSGWVGTGWSLDTGGVISRTVRGYADEVPYSGVNNDVTGVFHNDQFWNFENLSVEQQQQFIWNINGDTYNRFDAQPDLYQFSMMGLTGRFVIVKENGAFVAKQLDMNQKIKIHFQMNGNQAITSFTVIDANGYKYIFGLTSNPQDPAIETTLTKTYSTNYQQNQQGGVAPEWALPMPAANTAWHLTSIQTSNGMELAGFQYTNSQEYYKLPLSGTTRTLQNYNGWYNQLQSSYNLSQLLFKKTVSGGEVTMQTKKLTKITFRDQTSIHFILSEGHVENTGVYLDKIEIKKTVNGQDVFIRRFDLKYETQRERLWLLEIDQGNYLKHKLDYFDKSELPSAVEAAAGGVSDMWGYNNGDHRNDISYGFNYYSFGAVKKGLLTKIIYPTGGIKEFTWESNTFSHEGNHYIEDFDSNPLNTVTGNFSHQFKAEADGPYLPGQTLSLSHGQEVLVSLNILIENDDAEKFRVEIGTGQFCALSELPKLLYLPGGQHTVRVKVIPMQQEINTPTTSFISGYINIRHLTRLSPPLYKNYLLGGGVRISAIKFHDPDDDDTDDVFPYKNSKYTYEMEVDVDGFHRTLEKISSGVIDTKRGSKFKKYNLRDRRYLYTNGDEYSVMAYNIYYDIETDEQNVQLVRGNFVGYRRVLVSDQGTFIAGGGGETQVPNGYTEYLYTSAFNEPTDPGVFEYPYIEAENLDYKRGLLQKTAVYNKDKKILEETTNTYGPPIEEDVVKSYVVTPNPCEWRQFYEYFGSYKSSGNISDYPIMCAGTDCFSYNYLNCSSVFAPYLFHPTLIKTGRLELSSSTTKKYFYTGVTPTIVQSTSSYIYNPQNYQIKEQVNTYNEGAGTISEKTVYEYPVGGYTTSLFQGSDDLIDINKMVILNIINKPIVVTSYKNNELLQRVVSKYKTFSLNQLLLSEVETFKGGQPSTTAAEDRIIYSRYNEIGNVLEIYPAGSPFVRTCYVWGHNGTLPVAEIRNIPDYSVLPSAAITNIQAASLTGLESNMTASLITFRSDASVAGAQVTTLTHDPVDGVLSVTDPKNHKLTYKYDLLGRLVMIKDNDGNIISEYKYNFKAPTN